MLSAEGRTIHVLHGATASLEACRIIDECLDACEGVAVAPALVEAAAALTVERERLDTALSSAQKSIAGRLGDLHYQ